MENFYLGTQLEIRDLTKNFGGFTVLKSLNLNIAAGEFVAIVGRSGCGKTTLLRLLAGLDAPTSGSVLLDGDPLRQLNHNVRVMFQDARLLPWKSVIENVGLGLSGNWKSKAAWALAEVGLEERAKDWPGVLSGGQRQRVALARALVSQPSLLLLDEPLGALDALTRLEMQQLIEQLWQEQRFTAMLVTHDVEEAVALADRVVLIESGQIALNIPIPLPRPRIRSNSAFAELEERIVKRVMQQRQSIRASNKTRVAWAS